LNGQSIIINTVDERLIFAVEEGISRVRLEDYLLSRFRYLSKMYIRETVKIGKCEVNGRDENIGFRLRSNDLIEIELDPNRETAMLPDDIPLSIVHEDAQLIVIDKPSGMLTHPSHRENRGTLLNALAYYLNKDRVGDVIRPGLPHRLDKDTSGLIVIAKTAAAHRKLSNQFLKKSVKKRYLAVVEGGPRGDEGSIVAPIGRFDELKFWGVKDDGKYAESRFWLVERRGDHSIIEMEPVTGRTNQLRIHCQAAGHPIVGDTERGGREHSRLCLHAHRLAFRHPGTNEEIEFVSPMPTEFDHLR
jgi:23S rRNA pseudouridine1911/1915/1917 synthase